MAEDLTGRKFGRLTVLRRVENKGAYVMWECQCDCGNVIVARASNLKNGHTKSCGCYHKDAVSKANTTHGLSDSRVYRIYQHMIGRCTNPKEAGYEFYGGRGIKVCQGWLDSFEEFAEWAFKNGYADNLSIDRIDVNGNYCPENCRWATNKEQANNQRRNRILEYKGEELTMSEMADKYNVPYNLLDSRIFRGWSVAEAIETPRKENYVH